MKKLLFSLSIMIFAVALFTGCKQDPSSANNLMPMRVTPPPADAHPAWTFRSNVSVTSKGTTVGYATVAVSDSDATDIANLYTSASDNNTTTIVSPTWSASGSSVSFIEKPMAGHTGSYTIKAIDVSVSNGVASGSNVRTIYSGTINITAQAWCPAASVAKIAFITKNASGVYGIYTISTSGGTAKVMMFSSGAGTT